MHRVFHEYKKSVLTLTALLLAIPVLSPGQVISWTRQFGSSSSDVAMGVAVHATGVFVVGSTYGALPGQTNAGWSDAFIRKYDSSGNEIWTRQCGTVDNDHFSGVAVHGSDIYVVGETGDAFPGQTNSGYMDVLIRKYDGSGNEVWTRQFGSDNTDWATGVAADAGGIYVVGGTMGALPGQTYAGLDDAFVSKYDRNGNELWTHQFGTLAQEVALAVAAHPDGVYVVGWTNGALPGQASGGGQDAFIRKYDRYGNEMWTRQFGTSDQEVAFAVAARPTGVYVAGWTDGALPSQSGVGGGDAFIRKYDGDGNEVWTRQFGTAGGDWALGVAAQATGIYVIGSTGGALPGQVSAGNADAFIRKYDGDGNEVWTRQFGSAESEWAGAVEASATGIYVSGSTGDVWPDAFLVKITER